MAIPEDKIRIVEGDTLYGATTLRKISRMSIAYAKIRGIDIIPEIDMPGHMQAALAAYPNLGCTGVRTKYGKSGGYQKMCFAQEMMKP